jgi:hypothetical protein
MKYLCTGARIFFLLKKGKNPVVLSCFIYDVLAKGKWDVLIQNIGTEIPGKKLGRN